MEENTIRKLIKNIVTSGRDETYDIEVSRRVILLNVIGIIAVLNLVPLGILALIGGRPTLGIIDIAVAVGIITLFYLLRRIGYYVLFSFIGVFLTSVLFVYLFATGGVNNTGHLWYYIYPIATSFLLGSKRGAVAAILLFGFAVIIFSIQDYTSTVATYSKSFQGRFSISYIIVSAISYFYQYIQEQTQQKLVSKNSDLEIIVKNMRRAKDKQRETSVLLEAVLNSINDIIGIQDKHHGVIRYNEAGYNYLNTTYEEIKGKKCYELIGRDLPCDVCATTETYRTKKPSVIKKSLEETGVWLDVRAYPILDESGDIKYIVEHLRDITKEKKAEQELQQSEERYRSLVENTMDGYFVCRIPSGQFVFLNQRACDIFGYTMQEGLGISVWDVMIAEDHERIQQRIQARLEKSSLDSELQNYTAIRKDGSTFRAEISTSLVTFSGEMGVQGVLRDVTEHESLGLQLQQAQKFEAIGTLAGGIAHDFNNLLMGIQGRASLLSVDLKSGTGLEHTSAIEDYIRSATDLTKQLLGLARGGKYEVKPTDINELLRNSSYMFGRTKKEIRIHIKMVSVPLVVEVDQGQIDQVLLNLYINAWQAMPNGGDLYLKTQIVDLDDFYIKSYNAKPGRYALVSVTDTGVGMDKDIRQQIFDPFFTTKEKGRGTGLGLASAYGIIKNHDGVITVNSEVGHGTTFNIYLPLSDKTAHEEVSIGGELINGTENLLLVDDETMILEVGQAMLEKLGYHVLIANSGQRALETIQIKGDELDLVILDLIMPGMEGGKVFDCIKDIFPHMPVMLSSGYAINGQADKIMKKGCNGFLQKPFNISELSKMVRKILDEVKIN